MKIEIIYKSDNWMAINKPAGISTHNAEDKSVLEYMKEQLTDKKPYFVHRLDKETSGVLLIAFDAKTCASIPQCLPQWPVAVESKVPC